MKNTPVLDHPLMTHLLLAPRNPSIHNLINKSEPGMKLAQFYNYNPRRYHFEDLERQQNYSKKRLSKALFMRD